jgi:hypothetical protein
VTMGLACVWVDGTSFISGFCVEGGSEIRLSGSNDLLLRDSSFSIYISDVNDPQCIVILVLH